MVTFDNFVAFGPLIISIIAGFLAICNIWWTYVKDRPKIRITFQDVTVNSHSQPNAQVDAISVNIANVRGRPVTICFPDIVLPHKHPRGNILPNIMLRHMHPRRNILYLTPFRYEDVRKMKLTPNLEAGNSGKTPPFPYELAAGSLNDVWIENAELAAKLKELWHESGEVKLQIRVPNASGRPYWSKEFIFDVDKEEWPYVNSQNRTNLTID